jgi:predicted transcriptional regulator of viral defense system
MDNDATSMSSSEPRGITAGNRDRLTRLIRTVTGPFTVGEAAQTLNLDLPRTRRFLAYMAARGWLARVQRGLYVAVPLDASEPSEWRADPWVVAAQVFAPCYIGGWSACEQWGLTEQLFRDVAVVSGRWTRNREPSVQGTTFRVKVVSSERLFGTRNVWRGRVPVQVSDPARTIVDLLDDPAFGGGIRHVADVLTEWFASEHRDEPALLDYAERLGNRSVYKRLGFLVERLAIPAPDILASCELRMSTGVVQLDPSGPDGGPRVKGWSLVENVQIRSDPE